MNILYNKKAPTVGRDSTGQHYIMNYMGSKTEKGDVHVYAYVNHGAVHLKNKNLYNTVSHLYTNTKYTNYTNKKCRLYSPQALVTGGRWSHLEAWQAWS